MSQVKWDILTTVGNVEEKVEKLFQEAFDSEITYYNQLMLFGWKPIEDLYKRSDITLLGWKYPKGIELEANRLVPSNEPNIDIYTGSDHLVITIELPRLIEDSLRLEISGNVLIVRCDHYAFEPQDNEADLEEENNLLQFKRSFRLPRVARPGEVRARLLGDVVRIAISVGK
jgi:HSP20 family molecular chaperone IbpA